MEKETRKKSIQRLKMEGTKKVLCILEEENPLTALEANAVIECISDDHIALLAQRMPREISGRCITGCFVGQGTCLAKKFGKYGLSEDQACKSCKHTEILEQLNYIFREVFGGKYRAEWRQKREYKKRKSTEK
jgi:hypothetical protein